MFYFKYTKAPNQISYLTTQLHGLKNYLHMQCLSIQRSPYHQHKDIKAMLKKVIQMTGDLFKFNIKAFYLENFTQPTDKSYILVNSHHAGFTSHQPNNPWLCNKVNFVPIVKEIFSEALTNHKLSTSALQNEPYYPHIQILPQADIDHYLNHELHTKQLDKLDEIKLAYKVNHSNDVDLPYASNYRQALKQLWKPYYTKHYYFTAYYAKFQPNSTHRHQPAVLLQNVCYKHQLITNHCLLFGDNLSKVINSGAKEQTTIGFFAVVDRYIKHTHLSATPCLDFSLNDITNIQLNPHKLDSLPTDRRQLLDLISKYFDTNQLRYLLIDKIAHKKQFNQSLHNEINSVEQRLKHLRSLEGQKSSSQRLSKNTNNQSQTDLFSAVAYLWSNWKQCSARDCSQKFGVNTASLCKLNKQLTNFTKTHNVLHIQLTDHKKVHYSAHTIKSIYQRMMHNQTIAEHQPMKK